MAHIDNPREEFSKSTGIGIPLFLMLMYYAVNIAMVIIAVIAFFGFRNDYENQKKLMFATLRGESRTAETTLSATTSSVRSTKSTLTRTS